MTNHFDILGLMRTATDPGQVNWPAVGALALWVRADLVKVAEWVMSHGGAGMLIKKLWWNPSVKTEA